MSSPAGPGRWILVDTGPLYALLNPDDDHHERATVEMARLSEEGLRPLVVYPTLLEAYSLILTRLGTRTAHRWLGEIREGCSTLVPRSRHYERAAERLTGFRDQQISFFDALVAEVASVLELPVWTYDSDFDVMGTTVWR